MTTRPDGMWRPVRINTSVAHHCQPPAIPDNFPGCRWRCDCGTEWEWTPTTPAPGSDQ